MTSIRQLAREIGVAPSTVLRRLAAGHDPWVKRSNAKPAAKAEGSPKRIRKPKPKAEPGPRYITIDLGEVRQRVSEGMSVRAISKEIGASTGAVYRLCDKANIAVRGRNVPKGEHQDIDSAIADMSPAEALEYVLEAFKMQTGQDTATQSHAAKLGLTPTEAMVFGMLHRHLGNLVVTERLVAFMDVSQPGKIERNTPALLPVYIKRLRAKLAGSYTIRTAPRHGYIMVPA